LLIALISTASAKRIVLHPFFYEAGIIACFLFHLSVDPTESSFLKKRNPADHSSAALRPIARYRVRTGLLVLMVRHVQRLPKSYAGAPA